jgi:hypothetical protein
MNNTTCVSNAFILVGLSNESDLVTINKILDICKFYDAQILHLHNTTTTTTTTTTTLNEIQHILAGFVTFKPQMLDVFRDIVFIESGLIMNFKPSLEYRDTMNILVLSESLYNHFTTDIIMEEPYPASLLHSAVLNKEFNILVHLMEFTENPNIGTKEAKTTALHIAAKEAYMDELELLLSHPMIDVNALDILDDTPLTIASLENKTESVRRLLKHPDIDVKHKNFAGNNALYGGIINNNMCVIDMLLNHDAYKNLSATQYSNIYDDILETTDDSNILDYCYTIIFSECNDDSPNKINSSIAADIVNGLHQLGQPSIEYTDKFISVIPIDYQVMFTIFAFVQLFLLGVSYIGN